MKKLNKKNLLIFGGIFGLDKFYQGNFKLGILKLITLGGYGIWWTIDIILAYNELDSKEAKAILKNIFKPIGYIFLGLIILFIFLVIITPNNPNSQIIENTKVEDQKEEVSLDIKKNIYYIYWQSEHIASGLTFKKYGDGGKQEERDDFFKNTKLEYEKKLTSERGVDYEIYKKYALELGFGEGNDKDWERPNSNSDDVIKYVYTKEELEKIEYNKNIAKSFKDLKTDNNYWSQCSMFISGDGYLSKFTYAKIKKILNNKAYVYATFNGKNAFGQKIKQSVICKYQINEFGKYEIYDIKL